MSVFSAPRLLAALGGTLLVAANASAVLYGWTFNKGQAGSNYGVNNAGGTIETINATFDSATKRLTYDVLFSGANNNASPLVTNGFWLVINNGPNPKNHPGELAIMYFDASRVFSGQSSNPTLSVYEYNGRNANDSWNNGDGDNTPNEGNDFNGLIFGKNETAFINSISAQDVNINGQTQRRMRFDINASAIVGRSPSYPDPVDPWYGTGFDQKLGIWFHPAQIFDVAYQASGRGKITSLSVGGEGWLDGNDFMTTIIPTPSSVALLGLGGLMITRRRRVA